MVTKDMTFEEAGFTRETIDVKELLEFRRKQTEINEFTIKNIKAGDYVRFQVNHFNFNTRLSNRFKPIIFCGIMRVTNIEELSNETYLVIGKDELDIEIRICTNYTIIERVEYCQLLKGVALRVYRQTEYGFSYRKGEVSYGYEEDQTAGLILAFDDPVLEEHILNAMLITGEN